MIPEGFVNVTEVLRLSKVELAYATEHNFTGRAVNGYYANHAYLTTEAAKALAVAEEKANAMGYGLLIWDTCRPQRAVDDFVQWSAETEDFKTKEEYYPDYQKEDLFDLGFISKTSSHTHGSTVDLTLYDLKSGEALDMGGHFDFFSPVSRRDAKGLSEEAERNREVLKKIMTESGFGIIEEEWWHFTLKREPYPDTVFDFEVR